MSLESWLENGWLVRHETSVQEVHTLFDNAAEDILTARQDIAAGWKFAIAYNAALRLCSTKHVSLQSSTHKLLLNPYISNPEIKRVCVG